MSGFSIDDVRDSFTADIGSFLGKIEGFGRGLLEDDALAGAAAPAGFQALGDCFHTVYGTSTLVGANSLSETAKRLEALAETGDGALRRIAEERARARTIAAVCVEGANAMRAMLALELEHARAAADQAAASFAEKLLPRPTTAEDDPSLLDAFHEEGRQALETLESYIAALRQNPDDLATVANVERVFHTLKGAASTVGLLPATNLAKLLQERMERVLEGELALDIAFLNELSDDARRIVDPEAERRTSESSVDPGEFAFGDDGDGALEPSAPLSMRSELRGIFRDEAQQALGELRAHLTRLVTAPDDLSAVGQLERLYHTLKGAAATVGLDDVSRLASGLQAEMEGVIERASELDAKALADVVVRTNQLLSATGAGTIALELAKAAESDDAGLARKFFVSEAQQICARALELERELESAAPARAAELARTLGELFHRLRGSALLTTDQAVTREAERLERLCEKGADSGLGREIAAGSRRIAAALSFDVPSALARPAQAANGVEVTREAVELVDEPALWEAFVQECTELLESIDKTILNLETNDQPKRAVEAVFRQYHTLKGAVNTIGLAPTGRELHLVEDFLEEILERPILPSMKALATFLLSVQSDVRRQLADSKSGFLEVSLSRVQAGINRVLTGNRGFPDPDAVSGSREAAPSDQESFRGTASDSGSQRELAHEGADRKHIRVATERLDALMNLAGELVVSRSRLMSRVAVLRGLQRELGRSSRRLVDTVDRFREEHEFSLLDGSNGGARSNGASVVSSDVMQPALLYRGFTELELDRYDDVNVLSRSLAEITNDVNDMNTDLVRELAGFADDSDAFGTIVNGIQGEITRARMIPLESLFSRLRLPVRDAAEREAKAVRVENRGEEVSLDKTIADALLAPMLHLVRNAVVHGIETPELRAERGKPRAGLITLVARENSGQIVVEVQDDGGGLDLAAMHARGVALGLVRPETKLTDPAIKDLVFAPGLSTRASAGAVSGRGIGGDVARRAIERLNGDIRVETHPGKGTTFVMSLPITLAITRALLIRHRGRTFAVPLYFSERILDIEDMPVLDSAGVRRIKLDGAYMPARRMEELCGGDVQASRGPVLVLRVGDQRVALQVDAIVGQEEIVVKSLGELLTGHPLFAGVTIRGTGELALILDVPALLDASGLGKKPRPPELPTEPAAETKNGAAAPEVKAYPPALAVPLEPAITFKGADTRVKQKLRVLFVDDSLSVRKVAEKTLLALGTEVTLAVDGFEALTKLREAQFDIVFTDLEMPRMHGYDLIRELRFVPAYRNLPIVVVSSRSGQKHQQQAHQLGASDYLTKPFSAQVLKSALDRWCDGDGSQTARVREPP